MAQNFDFTYLIKKYSSDFVAEITSEGDFDDRGRWVELAPTIYLLRQNILRLCNKYL